MKENCQKLSETKKKVSAKSQLSDAEFFKILEENCGIFSRTAQAIEKTYGIPYSRQAVRQRAKNKKNKPRLEEIEESVIDKAENALFSLLESDNEAMRLKVAMFLLKTKGKNRGYSEKEKAPSEDPITIVFGGNKSGFINPHDEQE